MATIAVIRLPPETFALRRLFEAYPEATVEIERVIPTGTAMRPYFWVEGVPDAEIPRLLGEASGIDGVELVDTFDGRSLLRCNCATARNELFEVIATCDVSLLAADGDAEGWTLTLRGEESTALTDFDRASRDAGFDPQLRGLYDDTGVPSADTASLTDRQREALRLAFEMGYYEEPRETTLADVAAELDISRQALASRLRRGYRALIRGCAMAANT